MTIDDIKILLISHIKVIYEFAEDFKEEYCFQCTPYLKMVSSHIIDAKQECKTNPFCYMFFNKQCESGIYHYYCMNTGIHVEDKSESSDDVHCSGQFYKAAPIHVKSTLYIKGNVEVSFDLI